tara:strand:+ start:255 stop:866 length:612 start_codon:yes stop_codon:yes gene_type:complete
MGYTYSVTPYGDFIMSDSPVVDTIIEQNVTPIEREDASPVMEPAFDPFSLLTVMKKNSRYVAVINTNVAAGQLIEKSTFVITPYRVNEPDRRASVLANNFPALPCACDTCKIMGPSIVVPSGNMMLIQHSRKSNIKILFDSTNAMINLYASSDLKKGDELFINYMDLYPEDELSQEDHFSDIPSMQNMDLDKRVMEELYNAKL